MNSLIHLPSVPLFRDVEYDCTDIERFLSRCFLQAVDPWVVKMVMNFRKGGGVGVRSWNGDFHRHNIIIRRLTASSCKVIAYEKLYINMGLFPVTREPVTSLPLQWDRPKERILYWIICSCTSNQKTDPMVNVRIPHSSSNHCNRVQFRRVTPNLRIKMAILPYTRVDIDTFRTYGARIFTACRRADIIPLKW